MDVANFYLPSFLELIHRLFQKSNFPLLYIDNSLIFSNVRKKVVNNGVSPLMIYPLVKKLPNYYLSPNKQADN
jgi:hypothetical protein